MKQPISQDKCLICQAESFAPLVEYSLLPRVTSDAKPYKSGGSLHLCKACGALQKTADAQFIEESRTIYNSYDLYASSAIKSQVVFHENKEIDRAILIAQNLSPYFKQNVLDVGAGNGAFLKAVRKINNDILLSAFDIHNTKESIFNSIAGFSRFYSGNLQDIREKFDLVSVQHVLEHVTDPLNFLGDVKELINSGGSLFIQVPDNDLNPFDILVADHLTHFTSSTLRYLLELAGYEIVEFATSWVFKEISVVAKPSKKSVPQSKPQNVERVYSKVASQIKYLKNMAEAADKCSFVPSFGIFGSSISSSWLYGAIENKEAVRFFVDEDSTKRGGQHLGVPIFSPLQAPKGSVVYVPLATQTIHDIIKRSKDGSWPFKLDYLLSERTQNEPQ